jgi:DNA-binding MarR family transcriptional regulator
VSLSTTEPTVTEPTVTEPTGIGDDGVDGSEQLGDELVRLLKVMERTAAQVAARRGDDVDKAAFSVLHRLVHDGPQRSGALAEALLADPSTISRHVAQLVALGYVHREADPDDGRATVLAATTTGTEWAHTHRRRRNAAMATVVADWSTQDRSALTTLLARFTTDFEHHRPQMLAAREQVLGTEGES